MSWVLAASVLASVLATLAVSAPPVFAASGPAQSAPILIFGDSISAGYGIHVDQGWVERLRQRLKRQGYGYPVVNASVSGETTAGGLARLPRALSVHTPQIVVLELGGNDGLRALPIAQIRDNLERMVALVQAAQARLVLVGMRIPPNYGADYAAQFHDTFEQLARAHHVAFVPFLLEGIALKNGAMQPDGIHPNESSQDRLLDNVWRQLEPLLLKP
jgi:acyl-CoA thioesterase-1